MSTINTGLTLDVLKAARAGTTVLQSFGLLLGIFRFFFRLQIRRLWWEDAWALAALFFALAYLTGTWIYTMQPSPISTIGFWLYVFLFNIVIWVVRLSILFSVLRIVYPSQRLRTMMCTIAVLFIVMFLSFIGAKVWFYTRDLSWTQQPSMFDKPTLPLGRNLVIYELATDFIADVVLIGLPIRLLWSVKLPRKQRRMILLIFASGFIVTIASLFRAICQIGNNYSLVGLSMDVEVGFSTIMCNLLVCVTCIYRYGRSSSVSISEQSESDEKDDDYTTRRRPQTTELLTTDIELGGTGYSSDSALSTCQEECNGDIPSSSGMHAHSERNGE
ncbi:hypothetical protein SCLCIDRAFT_293921 [Scleroderma citrinum Foug A]|uniref:Rhodopsin domain-containing protein n=1 Tax=Scleroderma citrinum Foug A TaxID=1036808 RepID=A0A0C2ZZ62_9AGAM|nr:hypothetical protein SCLCIDRAFT_293921 [Scleroderma citrinum Foug A]